MGAIVSSEATVADVRPPRPGAPQRDPRPIRLAKRAFGRIARKPWLGYLLVALFALIVDVSLAALMRTPEPWCHDEFSYLLGADTYAHGRLTNPTHPLWVHFESIHIIQQPSYASKYPPGQGLMLAAGQVLGGHPLVGVWLSEALACMAIFWMLRGWVPARWALLGGFLAPLYPVMVAWSQSYWGGSVAVIGGCLVAGALRRLARRPRVSDAVAMGLGMAVLANSRPFEGAVFSGLSLAALLLWWATHRTAAIREIVQRVALPVASVLFIAVMAMGYYNWRVTGNALRMPYALHEQVYGRTPLFLWQAPRPEPTYRHKSIHDIQTGQVFQAFERQQTLNGFLRLAWLKVACLGIAFYPFAMLQVPLLMLPWVLKNPWMRTALGICLGLTLALLNVTWLHPHYAAPMTGLALLLEIQGMRHLRLWKLRGRPTGRLILHACVLLWVSCPLLICGYLKGFDVDESWRRNFSQREQIIKRFKQGGEHHLIVVRYGPNHNPLSEWVWNEADIDGSVVVWAREMDPAQNRKLLDYFKDRKVWLLEPDDEAVKLAPYPIPASREHADSSTPARSS
ncbi:MAG TPA: hypothetical protein VGZ22_31525 [Isosphaeraceae bacterium]|jgi:hypothetical protein|nr:hypothetical protein [Isosphaeraceae bacterium]